MASDVVIAVKNVAKDFILPHEKNSSIKSGIVSVFKKKNRTKDTQHALKDVSFEVKQGDFFGIVGRNGSGKSTLLKIISQIYKPTKGSVSVKGRLIPFIELGVGFNPELTGRENVFLNGALLGFSRKEIEERYDEIVDFAELQDFMDQKLKNYSSGMQVRLAFSVAIRADADVLILDEVLAVGDEAFQRKCNDYFYRAKREGKTVVLVTHSMESVRQFCNKAVLIDDGRVALEGSPDKVASAYSKMFVDEYIREVTSKKGKKVKYSESSIVNMKEAFLSQNSKKEKVLQFGEDFSISINLSSKDAYDDVVLSAHVVNSAGQHIFTASTKANRYKVARGNTTIRMDVENILSEGDYYLNVALALRGDSKLLLQEWEVAPFTVVGLDRSKYPLHGLTYPKITVKED